MIWTIAEDVVPLLTFSAALLAVILIPVRPGGSFSRSSKGFFVASILCYLISTFANIADHFDAFPSYLDPAVVSIELMWVPFILFGVYALFAQQQLNDAFASRHAVKKAGETLVSVMETAPAGIIVLNDAGIITFANGEARRLLDIAEDAPDKLVSSNWAVWIDADRDASTPGRHDFRQLVTHEPLRDTQVLVQWPNGWHRHLVVSTTPPGKGPGGGTVVAFLEREPSPVAPKS